MMEVEGRLDSRPVGIAAGLDMSVRRSVKSSVTPRFLA